MSIIHKPQFPLYGSSGSHPTLCHFAPMPCHKLYPEFLVSTHIFDLSQCTRNSHMSNIEALECFLLTITRHKFAGREPRNDPYIIQIIQNFLPVGIVTVSILTPFSPWNSSSLRPSDYCLRVLRVCWMICLRSGEKDGKCCNHTNLTSTPISQMLRSRRRQIRKSMAWDQGQHSLSWSRLRG